MRDVLGQKFFTDEISEELQYVPLNQVIKEVHEMPISKTTAHQGSILPIKNIPVPLDNNTYTYMNFNNNLVGSINPTYPTINHNNITYNQEIFNEIMVDGKHGFGVGIDEHTQNLWNGGLVPYNNYNVPASVTLTGETYLGQPVYRLAMTVDDAHAANLSDFQTSLNSHGVYGGSLSWVINTKYVSSIYWKPVNKMDTVFGGVASNITGWSAGLTEYFSDGWRRFYRYRTGNGIATKSDVIHHSFYCPSLQLNETIYIDFACPQTEMNKTYPTKYSIGTRNSTYLQYNINTKPKTISFWFKSNSNKAANRSDGRTLLLLGHELGAEDTSPYLQCLLTSQDDVRFGNSTNKVGLIASIGNDDYYCKIDNIDGADREWHHVTIEVNKDKKIFLWVDGNKAESLTYPADTSFGNKLRVGHAYIPSSQSQVYTGLANCTFDDLCIRTAHYENDEILQWYHSDREYYNPYDYSITI